MCVLCSTELLWLVYYMSLQTNSKRCQSVWHLHSLHLPYIITMPFKLWKPVCLSYDKVHPNHCQKLGMNWLMLHYMLRYLLVFVNAVEAKLQSFVASVGGEFAFKCFIFVSFHHSTSFLWLIHIGCIFLHSIYLRISPVLIAIRATPPLHRSSCSWSWKCTLFKPLLNHTSKN